MTISLRDKIASGRAVVGTWVSIPDIAVVEDLAQAGFDYLLIDGEHAPISPSQLAGDCGFRAHHPDDVFLTSLHDGGLQ
jgi:2-keto-3-deoxy-L-rhamnonate aldolase RhmA